MATTNMSFRLDSELKKKADAMFSEMGLNMSTAMNMFLRQVVRQGKIPFEIATDIPNEETIKAIEEVKEMKKNKALGKAYTDVDSMMKEN